MTHSAFLAGPRKHNDEYRQSAEVHQPRPRENPGWQLPTTKRQCVVPPWSSSPSATVEWFRPPNGWFTAVPVRQTPKRGRDGIDDLVNSLKRLRTTDGEREEEEEKEAEPVLSTSTALVLANPPQRYEFTRTVSPGYSLPPPMSSFPVVLYRGPPSPTLLPLDPPSEPPDIEEYTPLLSKENRMLRVSPSFTIELVDDDELDEQDDGRVEELDDDGSVQPTKTPLPMSDDEEE